MCISSTIPVSSSSKQPMGGAPPGALFISSAVFISIFVVTFFWIMLLAFCCRRRSPTSSEHDVLHALSGAARGSAFPVESLPTFAYSRSAEHGGGGECAVCLGVVQEGEMVRRLPACMHMYHVECIDRWLAAHRTCPLCRSELDPVKVVTPP